MQIPLFAHIAAVSFLIPAGFGFRHWRRLQTSMKIFSLFCTFSVFQVTAEFVLGRMGIANHFLSNIYMIVYVGCIFFLFSRWTQRQFLKDGLYIIGLMYFVFWILDVSFLPFPKEFRESIDTVASCITLIASVIILSQIVKASKQSVTEYSVFWIAIGTLLYSAGTIVIFSASNLILSMGIEYFSMLWHINWGFTMIANILYARSFLCKTF